MTVKKNLGTIDENTREICSGILSNEIIKLFTKTNFPVSKIYEVLFN